MTAPELRFDHLSRLTTDIGLFEHALLTAPRPEHGYCLDDVARGLVVVAREPGPSAEVRRLMGIYLDFTCAALQGDGRFHNRRREDGVWTDQATVDDHWGRALWALGTVVASTVDDDLRRTALACATVGLQVRSPWPRATAYAALGCFEILRVHPGRRDALALLEDARVLLGAHGTAGTAGTDPRWPWPEPRLTYANAVLPEALLVIGSALDDDSTLQRGLDLLDWLVRVQHHDGHVSVTPTAGWQPGELLPGFDQQPIEVAALAEACTRALEVTGDVRWESGIDRCAAWFLGANDTGAVLYDATTGGGYDGLQAVGINQNQGAESTLAALSTFQLARRVAARLAR